MRIVNENFMEKMALLQQGVGFQGLSPALDRMGTDGRVMVFVPGAPGMPVSILFEPEEIGSKVYQDCVNTIRV